MRKNVTSQKILTIGQLSKMSSIGIEAIRFYERQKLLPSPKRTISGYRQYNSDAIEYLNFISKAKELGFTLKEIKELLSLRISGKSSCSDVRQKATDKLRSVERKLSNLRKISGALKKLIKRCERKRIDAVSCPILEGLESKE